VQTQNLQQDHSLRPYTPGPCFDLERHIAKGLVDLHQLLVCPRFRERYISNCCAPVESELRKLIAEIDESSLPRRREVARRIMGERENAGPHELKRTLQSLKEVYRNAGSLEAKSLSEDPKKLMKEILGSKSARFYSLRSAIEGERQQAESRLEKIYEDVFLRPYGSAFEDAVAVWGISRNLRGDTAGGAGFHAGVIHYFEYHSSPKKSMRFLQSGDCSGLSMSAQGFIDYSKTFATILSSNPRENLRVREFADVSDNEGRTRRLILTDREMVVGFQHPGFPMGLLSVRAVVFSSETVHKFARMVEQEIFGAARDSRFNRLGGGRRLTDRLSRTGSSNI
jgi:hypothetical protein